MDNELGRKKKHENTASTPQLKTQGASSEVQVFKYDLPNRAETHQIVNRVHAVSDAVMTYTVQVRNTQIIEIGHNAAPAIRAAEIISSCLRDLREIR